MDKKELIEASINEKDYYLLRITKIRLKGLNELMDFENHNSGSDNGNQTLKLQDALESQLADKSYKILFLVTQVPAIYKMAPSFAQNLSTLGRIPNPQTTFGRGFRSGATVGRRI